MPFPAAFCVMKRRHSRLNLSNEKDGERKMRRKACGLLVLMLAVITSAIVKEKLMN